MRKKMKSDRTDWRGRFLYPSRAQQVRDFGFRKRIRKTGLN